ncbi:hypothetical protein [Pasteuria penetrans]|uniref:hypothetical protein n=1 Tax=Pasteuria penetrans TaxID=86005 RepID=UPI00165B2939|nr:hypothetical protein [Pasteuria penetrans]
MSVGREAYRGQGIVFPFFRRSIFCGPCGDDWRAVYAERYLYGSGKRQSVPIAGMDWA